MIYCGIDHSYFRALPRCAQKPGKENIAIGNGFRLNAFRFLEMLGGPVKRDPTEDPNE
jgi:hypothetical protein